MPAFRDLAPEVQAERLQARSDELRLKKSIADVAATIHRTPHVMEIIKKELARRNIELVDSGKRKKNNTTAGADWASRGRSANLPSHCMCCARLRSHGASAELASAAVIFVE